MSMAKVKRKGLGAVREALRNDVAAGNDPAMEKRRLVAELCRLLSAPSRAGGANGSSDTRIPDLSPRMRQTLDRLLAGDSEKQIAHRLGVSKNTVHVYVKALYRTFNVCSRGELLARFIRGF
jgi:DNA-binding NarL/FixJ family response regulator